MFKKNHDHRNDIPAEDSLDARLKEMGQKINAPYKLRNAAKTGMPLRVRDAVKPSVHIRHFARAALAYSLCVCVLVCGVLVVPGLFDGGNLAGSQMTEGQSSGLDLTDITDPEETEAPPSDFPPPDGMIPVESPLCGDALAELIAGKTNVNAAGMVDMNSLRAEDFLFWHSDQADKALQSMFNNQMDQTDCGANGEHEWCGGGVFAEDNGSLTGGAKFYFDLTAPATVGSYVIQPAWNNNVFTTRNPIEWTLHATNDPTLPLEQWTVLDYVWDSGIAIDSIEASGYEIAGDVREAYQHYCWRVTFSGLGTLNVDEFTLYVE